MPVDTEAATPARGRAPTGLTRKRASLICKQCRARRVRCDRVRQCFIPYLNDLNLL